MTSAAAGRLESSVRTAVRAQAVSTTTSAAAPVPVPMANATAAAPASNAQKKLLVGREVEEAAMWEQIKLHEAWDAGERRNINVWQAQQLEQAYERCGMRLQNPGIGFGVAVRLFTKTKLITQPGSVDLLLTIFAGIIALVGVQHTSVVSKRRAMECTAYCSGLSLCALRRCGEVTSEYAKTFFLGTQLMTPEQAKAIWAIYVWCRWVHGICNLAFALVVGPLSIGQIVLLVRGHPSTCHAG